MKGFFRKLFLLIFIIPVGFADAADLRAIEDKAAKWHLNNFIEVLEKARDVSVNSNITVLPNDHEAEQICLLWRVACHDQGEERGRNYGPNTCHVHRTERQRGNTRLHQGSNGFTDIMSCRFVEGAGTMARGCI